MQGARNNYDICHDTDSVIPLHLEPWPKTTIYERYQTAS